MIAKHSINFDGLVNGSVTFFSDRAYNAETETYGEYIGYKSAGIVLELDVQPDHDSQVSFYINGVWYYGDKTGHLTLNLSELMCTLPVNEVLTGSITAEDGVNHGLINIQFRVKDGIAPEQCILPQPTNIVGYVTGKSIIPPSVIYGGDINRENELMFELYNHDMTRAELQLTDSGGNVTQATINGMQISGVKASSPSRYITSMKLIMYAGTIVLGEANYELVTPRCGRTCILRWQSECGNYKQAIWLVRKVQKAANDSVQLATPYDGYKGYRGEELIFAAMIEGLNAYDYAYYADIITSSDVHCIGLQEINEALTDEGTRVEVVDTDYTIPDDSAGSQMKLEIKIKAKHYASGY